MYEGYRVTYKSRSADTYTCTYRFPIEDGMGASAARLRARAAAFGRADQFRLAIIAAGGQAATPVPYQF